VVYLPPDDFQHFLCIEPQIRSIQDEITVSRLTVRRAKHSTKSTDPSSKLIGISLRETDLVNATVCP